MELRIKEVAKLYNINLQQISKKLGITYSALHARMKGNMGLSSLENIANIIGCPVIELLPSEKDYQHIYNDKKEYIGCIKR